MLTSRGFVSYIISIAVLVCARAPFDGARAELFAQQEQTAGIVIEDAKRGIELYQHGDDKGAIELLSHAVKEHRELIGAWYYLGLAYERQGKPKDARKAYEKATIAGEELIDKIFTLPRNQSTNAIGQYKALLMLAAESADRYIKLNSNLSSSKVLDWNSRAESLREYAGAEVNNGQGSLLSRIYSPKEVTTKALITQRQEPEYTEEARKNGVSGTIVLRGFLLSTVRSEDLRWSADCNMGLTRKLFRLLVRSSSPRQCSTVTQFHNIFK